MTDIAKKGIKARTISWARKKSPWLYHMPCGGCNGCDIEVAAAITPRYDVERFGIKLVNNPRHSDILFVTGAIPEQLVEPFKRVVAQVPTPRVIVAIGACGCTCGIFANDGYSVRGPAGNLVDVDVRVPGCPPKPEAIIMGAVKALGILAEKQKRQKGSDKSGELTLSTGKEDIEVTAEKTTTVEESSPNN